MVKSSLKMVWVTPKHVAAICRCICLYKVCVCWCREWTFNSVLVFISCLTENSHGFHEKEHSVNASQGIGSCLLQESCETYECGVWGESEFLRASAKLRKATISFVTFMSVCLSVFLYGTSGLPLHEFSWNLIFDYISKICRESGSFIKI